MMGIGQVHRRGLVAQLVEYPGGDRRDGGGHIREADHSEANATTLGGLAGETDTPCTD